MLQQRTALFLKRLLSVIMASLLGCALANHSFAADYSPYIQTEVLDHPTASIYVVHIKNDPHIVIFPEISSDLASVEQFAEGLKSSNYIIPLAVINAGFFDPKNKSTLSFAFKNNVPISDPSLNKALMGNRNLTPFIQNILNRSEFRIMDCSPPSIKYSIQKHFDPFPINCRLKNSIQAGPNLYSDNAILDEAFIAYDSSNNKLLTRNPIGYQYKNARSAIGIDFKGDVILVMVSQKLPVDENAVKGSGLTIQELTSIMHELGAVSTMALDGGTSSSLWVDGQSFFGKLNQDNVVVRRRIKTVLVVGLKKQK